jgi:hypothetical protein
MIVQPAKLRFGPGDGNPADGLCLMQMVSWFAGDEQVMDHPACASPVLTFLGINLNDTALTQEARDTLWPLVWQLLDSYDPAAEPHRALYILNRMDCHWRFTRWNEATWIMWTNKLTQLALRTPWKTLRDIYAEAIALGRHGEEDPVYAPRAVELEKLLEETK